MMMFPPGIRLYARRGGRSGVLAPEITYTTGAEILFGETLGRLSYHELQSKGSDYDKDGLISGEELTIYRGADGIYKARMHSDLLSADSDGDGLIDSEDPAPVTPNKVINYDREAVISYCDSYALTPNADVYGYFGADCTNFVSQCLREGYIPENEDWYFKNKGIQIGFWYYGDDYSRTWSVANDSYNYFRNNKTITDGEIQFNSQQEMEDALENHTYNIEPGDLMYMQWEQDEPHHATIVYSTDLETIYYSGHTEPRWRASVTETLWSNNPNAKLYILHIKDVIVL